MDNAIDRLVDFIAARDPRFPQQIEGASAAEIERLEAAVERPLPAVYRRFLERMGRSAGWLKLGDARFDVASLIKYYEFATLPDPLGYLIIGRANGDPYYDVYLWQESAEDLRVVSFPPPPPHNFEAFLRKNLRRIAGSLPQMLGDTALAMFRNHELAYHRQVEGVAPGLAKPRLLQLDALLAPHGIAPLWYSNDWMRSYESREAVITAFESPSSRRLIVDLRAARQDVFNRLLTPLQGLVKAATA